MATLEIQDEDTSVEPLRLPPLQPGDAPLYLAVERAGRGVRLVAEAGNDMRAALVRTPRNWVLLIPPGVTDIRVGGSTALGLKVLAHGDRVELGALGLVFRDEHIEVLAADAELIRQHKACPVCGQGFLAGERVIYCPLCGLAHHHCDPDPDCWTFNRRCASGPFCGHVIA